MYETKSSSKAINDLKLLSLREVSATTGLSRTTIWRYVKAGIFPAPLQLGPNRICWRQNDIFEFIETLSPVVYAPDHNVKNTTNTESLIKKVSD